VAIQEVTWDRGGTESAGGYTLLHGKGNENHELGTSLFVHKKSYWQLRRLSLLVIESHKKY
jgi:hypothetical protein